MTLVKAATLIWKQCSKLEKQIGRKENFLHFVVLTQPLKCSKGIAWIKKRNLFAEPDV